MSSGEAFMKSRGGKGDWQPISEMGARFLESIICPHMAELNSLLQVLSA